MILFARPIRPYASIPTFLVMYGVKKKLIAVANTKEQVFAIIFNATTLFPAITESIG